MFGTLTGESKPALCLSEGARLAEHCWWTSYRDAGGWIDAVGVLDKVFPSFCDNRAGPCGDTAWTTFYDMEDVSNPSTFTRDGSCYAGTDTACAEVQTATLPNCCPRGQRIWSYTEFDVPYGEGGAITGSTKGDITIKSTSFSANEAGVGSTLEIVGATLSTSILAFHTNFLRRI